MQPKRRGDPFAAGLTPQKATGSGSEVDRRYGAHEPLIMRTRWEAQWQEFLKTVENPQSGWGILQLPEKPSPWEDAKAFLASFEQVAEACQWPQEEWVTRLLPALSGNAEEAYRRMDVRDREDYGKVPLEEAVGSVSEADRAPSGSEERHPLIAVKEEDDGEASLIGVFTSQLVGSHICSDPKPEQP
ncbi:UNVERIFIED_CONTAM: hypothetical protein K2H54_062502 [Gekko kuhli]